MKKYLISYFIISYIMNTIFVFVFSVMFGKTSSIDFARFLPSSIFYVLPYTLIFFVLVGIGTCYLVKLIYERKKYLFFVPLLLLTGLDTVVFVQFFNNSELSIILIRTGFLISSYLALYLVVSNAKSTIEQ